MSQIPQALAAAPIPWARFAEEVLALYRATRAPKTAKKMAQVLREFAAHAGPTGTADLTPEAVAGFSVALERGRHPNTVAGLLSYLRRACSYAASRGGGPSPFSAWDGFVRWVPGQGARPIAPAKIGRVLAHLGARANASEVDGRLHAWAATLAYTGVRRDEALFLRAEDVDLMAGMIRVRRRLKRPTARRSVPIPVPLAEILAAWMPRREGPNAFPNSRGKPWSGGAPGYRPIDRMRAAGEACGVKGFTPSALRHSFATACATCWNVPPATLQKLMGHTDLRTTMKYYVHLEEAHLIAAARGIAFPAA